MKYMADFIGIVVLVASLICFVIYQSIKMLYIRKRTLRVGLISALFLSVSVLIFIKLFSTFSFMSNGKHEYLPRVTSIDISSEATSGGTWKERAVIVSPTNTSSCGGIKEASDTLVPLKLRPRKPHAKKKLREMIEFSKKRGLGHTHNELFALSMPKRTNVSVILNYYTRDTACRQLAHIASQSVRPTSVHITLFDAKLKTNIHEVARVFEEYFKIYIVETNYNIGYYGRIETAMGVAEEYVMIIDDDMLIGSKYIETMLKASNHPSYHGHVLGSIGWIMPIPMDAHGFYKPYVTYRNDGFYFPDQVYDIVVKNSIETDILCSTWFIRKDMLRNIFNDRALTEDTGEDLRIGYVMNKYYNAKNILIPVDKHDYSTWGDLDHSLSSGSTTTGKRVDMRNSLWLDYFSRGGGSVTEKRALSVSNKTRIFFVFCGYDNTRTPTNLYQTNDNFIVYNVFLMTRHDCMKLTNSTCDSNNKHNTYVIDADDWTKHISFDNIIKNKMPHIMFVVGCRDVQTHNDHLKPIHIDFDSYNTMEWIFGLTKRELLCWSTPRIVLDVVTTCRMETLASLLKDLNGSMYYGDSIDISISVEFNAPEQCIEYLHNFKWKHGKKSIRYRFKPSGGPQIAIPESVQTSGAKNEYFVLLEDDISVSRHFYAWLKFCLLQAIFVENKYNGIYSISLYTPRVIETSIKRRIEIDYTKVSQNKKTYLYEVPCSWGALFFSSKWASFTPYFISSLQGNKTYDGIKNSMVNGWKGSWKKWLIELGYYKHIYTLYPSFNAQMSFSTNLLGQGEHIKEVTKQDVLWYTVPLFSNNSWYTELSASGSTRVFEGIELFNLHFERI